MQTDVKVRERDAALVLSKRIEVRRSQVGPAIGTAFQEVYGYLGRQQVQPTDEPFVIYLAVPGLTDLPFPISVCAPVPGAIDPPEGWLLEELAGGTFASIVHVGSYESLGAAYDELEAWIGEHELAIAGPPREVYLSEPGTPASEIRTVVEFPVEPSRARLPVSIT